MAVSSISSIKERLTTLRKELGLSQRAFCQGIYLSQSFYAQIETGAGTLNDRIIELIAFKYHANREWLKTGKGEMFDTPLADRELRQLIDIYKELDPLFREYILLQIKQLLGVQKRSKKGTKKPKPE
jgi:transcriptional regulator with XRE-family HTH domain